MPRSTVSISETLTADSDTATISWYGGVGTFSAVGTFGSGTATLQCSYDKGMTFINVGTDTTLAVNGHGNFDLPHGILVKANLNGSTAAAVALQVHPR